MLLFRLLFLLLVVASSAAAESAINMEELEQLSDPELEGICTNLGFMLVTEDQTTGQPLQLQHADYVEAARQCLQIQEEMEEVLAENPELRKEYEEERDRMLAAEEAKNEQLLAEKARLEKELAAQQQADGGGGGAFGVGKPPVEEKEPPPVEKEEPVEMKAETITPGEPKKTDASPKQEEVDEDDLVAQVVAESSSPDRIDTALDTIGSTLDRILPDKAKETIEKVLPKPTQQKLKVILSKVLHRVHQDGKTFLKFAVKQIKALMGQAKEKMEERRNAKEADAVAR